MALLNPACLDFHSVYMWGPNFQVNLFEMKICAIGLMFCKDKCSERSELIYVGILVLTSSDQSGVTFSSKHFISY